MLRSACSIQRSTKLILAAFILAVSIVEVRAATTVAVIDSGVDADHIDLEGKVIKGYDLTAGSGASVDRVGHGTAMASLIAGHQVGTCPDCRVFPLKITDGMSVGLDRLAAAIDIAVDEGVSLIYVGAGAVETNQALQNAVARAHAKGIQIVAPVGTDRRIRPLYPAAYETVVGVAALDRNGQLASTSNNPGNNAAAALGQDVIAAKAGGGYINVSGSSPAAAVVAGRWANGMGNDVRSGSRDRPVSPKSSVASPIATLQYGDTDDTDIILDAPWRTIRDYLPFLVFVPEFEQNRSETRTLKRVELHNFDPSTGTEKGLIFQDVPDGSDQKSCAGRQIEIIDSDGRTRNTIGIDEPIEEFWHYVARIPVACVGFGERSGSDGEHYLLARVHWETETNTGSRKEVREHDVHRVLRVLVGNKGFPRFDSADHYYDAHVHTIAEQTGWNGIKNVNASRKAYGGPLAMLTESAYALGLIETQLRNGNWKAFRDQLATTDHNAFFSDNPYDAGTAPGHGPTGHTHTDGKKGEFQWYRDNFGELGGEEVSLAGTGRTLHSDMTKSLASHFLVYGGPHIEGPWHGGHFTVDLDHTLADKLSIDGDITTAGDLVGVRNPNGIESVLARLSETDAFGYAAHPFSKSSGWSKGYFEKAIGLPPYYNSRGENNNILQRNSRDFIFKGSQVWNEKHDRKSTAEMLGGHLTVKDLDKLDPFTARGSKQQFVPNPNWARSLNGGLSEYVEFIKRGLKYTFQEQPDHRLIRKLYVSAGTDAHGDFNYLTSLESTAVAEVYDYFHSSVDSAAVSSNAFGRVRTYTLTGEKMGRFPKAQSVSNSTGGRHALKKRVSVALVQNQVAIDETRPGAGAKTSGNALRASVNAYREGNTILTDGPICKFSVDSECRFDSSEENPRWHDDSCAWENADGRIGGEGDFDGGGSALISRGSNTVLNTTWDGRNDYVPVIDGQPDNIRMSVNTILASGSSNAMTMDGGLRGKAQYVALSDEVARKIERRRDFSPSALMMRGNLGSEASGSVCITNPVWTIPVKFYYSKAPTECSIRSGELRVSVEFGVSMDTTVADRCSGGDCLAPVDGAKAAYSGATIKVYPLDGAGNSVGKGVSLSPLWSDNSLPGAGFGKIADAKLAGTNDAEIACPSGGWDATTHSKSDQVRSYAVIVSNLRDMHGNELNAVADTFTVTGVRAPEAPRPPKRGPSCSDQGSRLCGSYDGSCEVTTAANGVRKELCRWSEANTASQCRNTVGIWTATSSKYAKNHPDAVAPGSAGACITEVRNLKNRIE